MFIAHILDDLLKSGGTLPDRLPVVTGMPNATGVEPIRTLARCGRPLANRPLAGEVLLNQLDRLLMILALRVGERRVARQVGRAARVGAIRDERLNRAAAERKKPTRAAPNEPARHLHIGIVAVGTEGVDRVDVADHRRPVSGQFILSPPKQWPSAPPPVM